MQTRSDVATCLVTGNLEPIGWGKMEAVGLLDLFSPSPFGGFGSDFCSGNTEESWRDRAELIRIAATRASNLLPCEWQRWFLLYSSFQASKKPVHCECACLCAAVFRGLAQNVAMLFNLLPLDDDDVVHVQRQLRHCKKKYILECNPLFQASAHAWLVPMLCAQHPPGHRRLSKIAAALQILCQKGSILVTLQWTSWRRRRLGRWQLG